MNQQILIGKELIGGIFESIFLHLEQVAFFHRIIVSDDGLGATFGGSFSEEQRKNDNNHDDQCAATQPYNSSKYRTGFERMISVIMMMMVFTACRFIRNSFVLIFTTSFILVQTKPSVFSSRLSGRRRFRSRWWGGS